MSEAFLLEIDRLSRRFGAVQAVRNISLRIPKGEVFGLLGPNGAGKTTTIKLILGLLAPTAGSITVDGVDAVSDPLPVRRLIGWVPQHPTLDPLLTGREQLLVQARLYGVANPEERADLLLRQFNLTAAAHRLIKGYSGGLATIPGLLWLALLLGAGTAAASLTLAFVVPRHGLYFTLIGIISLPMIFLSTAFAPLESLPAWLAGLSRLNPLTYAVEGARSLILHGWNTALLAQLSAAIGLFAAVMLVTAGRVMRRKLPT